MKFLGVCFIAFFGFQVFAAQTQTCQSSCDSKYGCESQFFIDSHFVTIFSNYEIDQSNLCVEKIVIALHGNSRKAKTRFNQVKSAANLEGVLENVLVIAPSFKTLDDAPDVNELFYSSHGWKKGNTSNNPLQNTSSFSVIDELVEQLVASENFPNLKAVSLTGHSAGGQFSQLYALTTKLPERFLQLQFSFFVLNPSSYAYLNEYRKSPRRIGEFEIPIYKRRGSLRMRKDFRESAGNCPNSFNDFKYGLEERNKYSRDLSESELVDQYLNRKVYYFLGEEDVLKDSDLNQSCAAKLQGEHRLDRGNTYYEFLNRFFKDHEHEIGVVKGVGHDSRKMHADEALRKKLFQM